MPPLDSHDISGACFWGRFLKSQSVPQHAADRHRHPKGKPRDKPRKLYDSRGLYLEIAPRGTKAWRFKYRFADKEKRISMGIYPEVSLKLARERSDDARKLLAREIDPSAYRKAQKQSKRQWARNQLRGRGR